MKDAVTKSWFAVLNNPAEHGYAGTPEEVCCRLRDEWLAGGAERTGAWAFCISADGLPHVHMVLEDVKAMRFSAVKMSYAAGTHFEATKGNKKQAEAYIEKRPPFDEKGEQVICVVRHGEIKAAQGKRSDLDEIATLLDVGLTPEEIFRQEFRFRRYERMVTAEYMERKRRETPVLREIKTHYFVGDSGTGKSHKYVELCEKYGEDKVYHVTDYLNGGFDLYRGQPILFLDEFKGGMPYGVLLSILDKYKSQIHARYANIFALWNEVYIASIFSPETLYTMMVPQNMQKSDPIEQFFRRLTDITYCFRDGDSYRRYTQSMAGYAGYNELRAEALERIPLSE